ncbi:MAG: 50S ribosomal protein L25 [Candidatus Omnitrophica bacterium]|nr:50S ribosomal protein L25 [Candidatus Omnitrophota bacterium]MBU4488229.1 50S ribosomal protein L25 [Candidatus Omnitrophota bacterium]MCG2704677.1 50S ribosomal protein L25 [Candidatus Omnitrophota bacterium]
METIQLNAEIREAVGKKSTKQARNAGLIPAVVYKEGKDTVHLKINSKELMTALKTKAGANVLVNLKIGGAAKEKRNERTVLIKEIQIHPLKDKILHVDFQEISLSEKMTFDVPLVTKGEAEGVVKDEGVLEHVLWELKIECLPTAIPAKIEVDVTSLKIGDSILVKDIVVSPDVKILNAPDQTVITVKMPHVEETKEEGVEEVSEPELIREKKEKEEAEGEEEAAGEEKKEDKKEEKK